jgi:hypothetical protein
MLVFPVDFIVGRPNGPARMPTTPKRRGEPYQREESDEDAAFVRERAILQKNYPGCATVR